MVCLYYEGLGKEVVSNFLYYKDHSKAFSLSSGVIYFFFIYILTSISIGLIHMIISKLSENFLNFYCICLDMDMKFLFPIRESQNSSFDEFPL